MSGASVLALVGINEFGLPMRRWLGSWRWAPPLVGAALIAAGALLVHAPKPDQECGSSIATGPGRWIALAAAALGAVAVTAIFISARFQQSNQAVMPPDRRGVKTAASRQSESV